MNTAEIMQALQRYSGEFPREALEAAIANPEAIIPELLETLRFTVQNVETLAQPDNEEIMGYLYALYLLAQFRETRAYPLMIELLSAPGDDIEVLLGDGLTEDGGRWLASVYDGDIEPLKRLVENPAAYEYARSQALHAMLVLVAQGVKTREEILEYFASLFREILPRDDDSVWSSLVSDSADLYPDTLYEDIKQAFEDDLIDPLYIDLDFVDMRMERGKDQTLAELMSNPHYAFIDDTVAEMENWAAFVGDDFFEDDLLDDLAALADLLPPELRQSEFSTLDFLRPFEPLPYFSPPPLTTVKRTEPKVGRNDPCPCGSGLKYKKCHGKRSNQQA